MKFHAQLYLRLSISALNMGIYGFCLNFADSSLYTTIIIASNCILIL